MSAKNSFHRPNPSAPGWHAAFLAMLPSIAAYARLRFRYLDTEARQEAVQECIANALVAFARLVQLGKADIAYPTPLARYAVAQVKCGRRTGTRQNVRDISSAHCQRQKGVVIERLDQFDEEEGQWREILVEDRRAGPAEVAATRMDFAAYLRMLPCRLRKIAKVLAAGETTCATARRFHLCNARISQIRRELKEAWELFQGEQPKPAAA